MKQLIVDSMQVKDFSPLQCKKLSYWKLAKQICQQDYARRDVNVLIFTHKENHSFIFWFWVSSKHTFVFPNLLFPRKLLKDLFWAVSQLPLLIG